MTYDVIIIGAGIIGLSTAYQIARRSGSSVLVLEAAATLGAGSSGASSAICRHRYSQDQMVELARDGIRAYRQWAEFTRIDSPRGQYHQDGALWINQEGKAWADDEQARLNRLGVEGEVLSDDEITTRFPSLSTCTVPVDLERGSTHQCYPTDGLLFEPEAGYFDPVDALFDLLDAARVYQFDIRFSSPVERVLTGGGRATGVVLASGEQIGAGSVINTNGPWCNQILEPLGLAERWPLNPTRIQVLHIDRPSNLTGKLPVCCDSAGGVYFREQNRGQQIVLGSARAEDERETVDPTHYHDWVDDDFKAARLHGFKHRCPDLPDNINVTGYTGLYTVNDTDVHPIVGKCDIPGLYLANGFSGHGFKLAPAIGSLLARTITGLVSDFDTDVDNEFLAVDRQPLSVDSKSVLA